jgi:hypothetical protein
MAAISPQIKPVIDPDQLVKWLKLFVWPGDVVELRALEVAGQYGRPVTVAGYYDFDHLREMAQAALRLDTGAKGIYFTLNPVKTALLARRCNRVEVAGSGGTTSDGDILSRRWLPIDADPRRPAGVSSTAPEKTKAFDVILNVRTHLAGLGWPAPILADSGNGFHLLYRIDLPADDGGLVERILKNLAARFDNDAVAIDQRVFNCGRIWKLFGTASRKGDSTADRPHRRSCILEA